MPGKIPLVPWAGSRASSWHDLAAIADEPAHEIEVLVIDYHIAIGAEVAHFFTAWTITSSSSRGAGVASMLPATSHGLNVSF